MNRIDELYNKLSIDESLKPVSEWNNDESEVCVTIDCLAYNHEEFLERAIESFLMQKVNFRVEIHIHDDCSTDSTALIIKKYEEKYPNIIKGYFESENIYQKTFNDIEIERKQTAFANGKYIAFCEGDDYWIDPLKLIMQVTILEEDDSIRFSTHRVQELIYKSDNNQDKTIPNFDLNSAILSNYEAIELVNRGYPFQTSCYFVRTKDYKEYINNLPKFATIIPTSDEGILYYFCHLGKTCFINKTMSCWLKYTPNSWNIHDSKQSSEKQNAKRIALVEAIREFYNYTGCIYPSCLIRMYDRLLVVYISKKEYRLIFKEKGLKKALRRTGIKRYIKIWLLSYFPFARKIWRD